MAFRINYTFVLALVMFLGVFSQTSFAGIDKSRAAIKGDMAAVEMKADKDNATYQKILAAHKGFEKNWWAKERYKVYEEIGAIYNDLVPYAKSIGVTIRKPDWLN